jgi:hypothetical protein
MRDKGAGKGCGKWNDRWGAANYNGTQSLNLKNILGAIIIGGGVVKHHIMNANLMRNGADHVVLINTGQVRALLIRREEEGFIQERESCTGLWGRRGGVFVGCLQKERRVKKESEPDYEQS